MPARAVAVAILALVLVGCEAVVAPSVPASRPSATAAVAIASLTTPTPDRATPLPTHSPTPAVRPAPPTGVRIKREGCYTGPESAGIPPGRCTTTVTWKQPLAKGTEIRIYGVTGCLTAKEVAGDGTCLAEDTAVPASVRHLIAKVPASRGRISWTRPAWLDVIQTYARRPRFQAIGVDRDGEGIYFAIVMAANSAKGRSRFVVADTGTWCYDTGCTGP